MNRKPLWIAALVAIALSWQTAVVASERLFTYTYEPETLPKGATEFEQWVTLRAGRDSKVGQKDYTRWEIREEIEHGFTDNYTASLYLNMQQENFRDPATKKDTSDFDFKGVSLENIYMLLNPAEHKVGLSLYLEGTCDGDEAELEQKILIGQRCGDWKWAVNFIHATEWDLHNGGTEGEFEFVMGISRQLSKQWALGIEARDKNEIPEYNEWENTAIYVGPAVHYRSERWWATLSILPQVWGENFGGGKDPDGVSGLELEGNERVNVRLVMSIDL
ncbi:MAG: hypothetical protein EXS18_06185 [Verrucomicrobiae bacterium]|nr:hypothetical protein [Verrucomicrobiae bacterium]